MVSARRWGDERKGKKQIYLPPFSSLRYIRGLLLGSRRRRSALVLCCQLLLRRDLLSLPRAQLQAKKMKESFLGNLKFETLKLSNSLSFLKKQHNHQLTGDVVVVDEDLGDERRRGLHERLHFFFEPVRRKKGFEVVVRVERERKKKKHDAPSASTHSILARACFSRRLLPIPSHPRRT